MAYTHFLDHDTDKQSIITCNKMRTLTLWITHLFVFSLAFEDMITLPGIGSFARFMGFVTIGCWFASVLLTGRLRKPHIYFWCFGLYVWWQIASIMWSMDRSMTMERIKTYVQLVLMIMVLWDLYLTTANIKHGLQAYVWGAYMLIGGTFYNFLLGISFVNSGRYSAGESNPNDMGLVLALGIPLAWHLIMQSQKSDKFYRMLTVLNYLYIPLAIIAIILTASRTSFILIFPSLIFLLFTMKQMKLTIRLLIMITFLVAAFTLQSFVPSSSFDRLSETSESLATGDLTGRGAIWQQGWAVFLQHPLLGVGSGAYASVIPLHQPPHNIYLAILTETGIIGFCTFALLLGVVGYAFYLNPRSDLLMWGVVLLIWMIGVSALNWEFRKTTWLILTLLVTNSAVIDPLLRPIANHRQLGFTTT